MPRKDRILLSDYMWDTECPAGVGLMLFKKERTTGRWEVIAADRQNWQILMMKGLICLTGAAILVKSGQALGEPYSEPLRAFGEECMASLAENALAMYYPAIDFEEELPDFSFWYELSRGIYERLPVMGFLMRQEGDAVVTEDEYTHQELIEAGKRTFLQALQQENQERAVQEENQRADTEPAGEEEVEAADMPSETEEIKEGQTEEQDESRVEEEAPDDDEAGEVQETDSLSALSLQALLQREWDTLLDYDTLLGHYFVVDSTTMTDEEMINIQSLSSYDMKMKLSAEEGYQILIYHTHSQEEYADSVSGDDTTTVVGVGDYLSELLEGYGYKVYHMRDTFDLVDGRLERSKAYTYAREGVQRVLEENPTIQVILDIHRDGVSADQHLVTEVDGRATAQFMYFNGLSRTKSSGKIDYLENPYIQENLAFSFQAEYLTDYLYPGLCRCIYLKGYRYNLDLRPQSMLVEVGAQTNTLEEAKNAMIPLARVLHELLQG